MFLCKDVDGGVRILGCGGYDGRVSVPKCLNGRPVTEIGAYAFSSSRKIEEGGIWITEDAGGEGWTRGAAGRDCGEVVPVYGAADPTAFGSCAAGPIQPPAREIRGDRLISIELPDTVCAIGRYAFYNCDHLEEIALSSTVRDIGSGVFTGSTGVRLLDITIKDEGKSCFKEILSELRQELYVDYKSSAGRARLVFPPYFEEAVENTPAKVFRTEIHGCGHRFRYCFDQTEFQFKEYDALFPHVQVQEAESLVMRLVLGRLFYPLGLTDEAREVYTSYLSDHLGRGAGVVLRYGEPADILFLAENYARSREELDLIIEEANRQKRAEALGCLMDYRHRHYRAERRRHTL